MNSLESRDVNLCRVQSLEQGRAHSRNSITIFEKRKDLVSLPIPPTPTLITLYGTAEPWRSDKGKGTSEDRTIGTYSERSWVHLRFSSPPLLRVVGELTGKQNLVLGRDNQAIPEDCSKGRAGGGAGSIAVLSDRPGAGPSLIHPRGRSGEFFICSPAPGILFA